MSREENVYASAERFGILQALGQGIVIPLLLNMILSTISSEEAGMACGVFSTIQVVGSAFGVTIVGTSLFNVFDQFGGAIAAARPTANAYGEAFSIATIYNLIAIVLALAIFARLQPSQGASSSS